MDPTAPAEGAARTALAELLAAALRKVGAEVTGRVIVSDDAVHTLGGALVVTAERTVEPGQHPSVAHVHVVARVGRGPTVPLETCVVAVNESPDAALAEVADNWLYLAAAPILMLLTQRHIFDAEHFGEHDAWGVPGLHGFVGSVFLRGHSVEDPRFAELARASFFRDAATLVTDNMPHLLKSTIATAAGGGWVRTLELDGHRGSRRDEGFEWEIPAPDGFAACVRYAVVFRGQH